jgi:raffinose/stachyose/melibiose transport system permease protein
MVLASFRSQGMYLTENPWLPSGGLTVSEYGTVFGAGLGRYLVNSAILTAVCVALTLTICLTKLEGQYAINVPAVMAAVLLSVLPLVVLFAVMRKQVMRSLGSVVMR